MGSTPEFRRAFVARLNQACDESDLIPAHGMGRQKFISERLNVVAESVSKWFKGIAMPKPDKMEELANLLECDKSWLALGVTPEMDRTQRKVHVRKSDGAINLVLGMMMLDGAHCGEPGKNDPRSAYVDFYANIRGSTYPIHVSLGRELSKDHYEVIVPKEFNDVHSIAVIPAGPGRYHPINMPLELVQEHKIRKAGAYAIQIGRVDGNRYMTGSDVWPRIRTFRDLV